MPVFNRSSHENQLNPTLYLMVLADVKDQEAELQRNLRALSNAKPNHLGELRYRSWKRILNWLSTNSS